VAPSAPHRTRLAARPSSRGRTQGSEQGWVTAAANDPPQQRLGGVDAISQAQLLVLHLGFGHAHPSPRHTTEKLGQASWSFSFRSGGVSSICLRHLLTRL